MKQLLNSFPQKICKFGACLTLACALCTSLAYAVPTDPGENAKPQSSQSAAEKEAEPAHGSLISEQPDSSAAEVSVHDYLEAPTLLSKTFLFPQDAFENQGGTLFNAYRKYLYRFEKSPEGVITHFRHYEYGLTKDMKNQTFPYDLPVCSGRGLNFWLDKHSIIATIDEIMDGTELIFCAVPPNTNIGQVFRYKGACCKMGQKLFTVKTPAGTFKDCLSVSSCAEDGSPVDGANLTFYAPKLGEILNLIYDSASQQYKVKAILVSSQSAKEPHYAALSPSLTLNRYMYTPYLCDKAYAHVSLPGKQTGSSYSFYKLIHPEGFGRSKVFWMRFDTPEDFKASDKPKNPPVKGVDFLDAETDSIMRMCDEDPAPNTVIPPLESADTNYQFNHRWYKLSSQTYNISTDAGEFVNCLQVTYFGDTPDVLDGNSYRAYYAPDLGEICRDYYNPQTKKFEGYEILRKYNMGASKTPKGPADAKADNNAPKADNKTDSRKSE
ncbi:hypothetical protein IJT93_01775 [bacterium]|nr:hypothetical protein [bacterium]